ncbi:hypothetical protein TWF481_005421 [Arthrobotrys musiformis]|uniref:Pet127-domain-containing protein n=1 Tax=Arthrobotrys musiformis TaxID=47236 RepID=A0AAV9WFQ8_9PEZI
MLRMKGSLARAGLRPLTNQRSPWICRTCQIHQSAALLSSKLEETSFPARREVQFKAVGTRKRGALPMDDTMSEEDRKKVLEKKRKEHIKFVEKLEEFIDARRRVASKLRSDAEGKKKTKAVGKKGPKTAEVIMGREERQLKRAKEIHEVANLFTLTPPTWPSVGRMAITSDRLMLMHAAMKETMEKMKVETTEAKSWIEASRQRARNDALYYPLVKTIEPLEEAQKEKENIKTSASGEASQNQGQEALENQEQKESEGTETKEKKPRKSAREKKLEVDATTISAKDFELEPIDLEQNVELRPLSHGLDRVLFNPGVTFLRDPRSRVYNFDPYLDTIMPVDEFDFDALGDYITSSKDTTLIDLARESKKKYVGSTSSMTSILSHIHYLISRWRPINTKMLSKGFVTESDNFTRLSRLPTSVILRWKDGIYAIDQDKEVDSMETILLFLGRSMEKMLTLPPEVFQKYHKSTSHEIPEEVKNARERYHYTGFGDLLFRSQLDAHDDRLPGTGVFDLKTRGVISIRMNAAEPAAGWGYQIKTADGQFESFEREYYDLIRSAFMKYSLQVRMGRMDGCFVAYHNTKRIFGFQYISIDEMDEALHGCPEIGDQEFKLSLKLLNEALDRATKKYPEQSLRLWFETRESAMPFLYFAAEPVTEEEIIASQEKSADLNVVLEQIRKSSNPPKVDGMGSRRNDPMDEAERQEMEECAPEQNPTEAAAEEIIDEDQEKAENTISALQESTEMLESVTVDGEKLIDPERDAKLLAEGKSGWEYLAAPKTEDSTDATLEVAAEDAVKDTAEVTAEDTTKDMVEDTPEDTAEAATEDGLESTSEDVAEEPVESTEDPTTEEVNEDSTTDETATTSETNDGPFVQVLVAQSSVNGNKVDRPTNLTDKDVWSINYAFLDMDKKSALKTLSQIKKRKKEGIEFDAGWKSTFMQHLKKLSRQGEKYAAQQKREDEESDIVVYRRRS